MSISQRNKGNAGERELFLLLSENLGIVVKRNLSQTRGGGADSLDVAGWAIECKRQEKINLNAWWQQAEDQAYGLRPALFYRASRQPWRAMMRLADINPAYEDSADAVILSFDAACMIIREDLCVNLINAETKERH